MVGFVFVGVGLVAMLGLAAALWSGSRSPRWCGEGDTPPSGPYRTGGPAVTRDGMPWDLGVVSAAGYLWGLVTTLVFAPAGLLLSLISLEGTRELWGVGFGGIALFGAGLGVALVVTSVLSMHRRVAPWGAALLGLASVAHHVLVLVWFAVGHHSGSEFSDLIPVVAGLCAIGALHALVFGGLLPLRLSRWRPRQSAALGARWLGSIARAK